jgi:hypothetical protein
MTEGKKLIDIDARQYFIVQKTPQMSCRTRTTHEFILTGPGVVCVDESEKDSGLRRIDGVGNSY